MDTPRFIIPSWPAPQNVKTFCTTRCGGFSHGPYNSLNVGAHVGDDETLVSANRDLLPRTENIIWLSQIHSNICVKLSRNMRQNIAADASCTKIPGLICAVMSADCLPILLCNKRGTVVAAVHAGWKGLAAGIIENSLEHFNERPEDILAWLGPGISQQYFEVGEAVLNAFADHPHAFRSTRKPDKYLADLYRIARDKLMALGIKDIFGGDYCTYRQSELFFSHRRSSKQGTIHTGRMVCAIYLQN